MRVPGTKRLCRTALAAALTMIPAGALAQDEPMREPPPPAPLPQRVRPPAIPLEQRGCECPTVQCPGMGGSGASEEAQQGVGQVPESQSVHEGSGGAKRESQPPPEP